MLGGKFNRTQERMNGKTDRTLALKKELTNRSGEIRMLLGRRDFGEAKDKKERKWG